MKSPCEIFLTFDLETTGLSSVKHAVCEIACCPMDSELNDLPEYTSGIIKPYGDRLVDDKALEHNGITREQLSKGRDSGAVVDEFIKYLKSFRTTASKIILVGHNIDVFDIPHLKDLFEINKKDLFKFVSSKCTIDTMWWGRMAWTESVNYKLGTCCSNAGVELVDAHRALTDTRANKELAKVFLKNLRGEGQVIDTSKRTREEFQM